MSNSKVADVGNPLLGSLVVVDAPASSGRDEDEALELEVDPEDDRLQKETTQEGAKVSELA
jgi:hypothetical protein